MAIAFDATSTGTKTGTDTNSLTVSHTCTGTDRALWVGCTAAQGDYISSVTYNGTAMAQAVKRSTAGNLVYLYYLENPSSGANNIVINVSTATQLGASNASYTGVDQTSMLDATNSASSGGTSSVVSVTTTVDNCWTVAYCGIQRASTASTGLTGRVADGVWGATIADSGADITPTQAYSMTMTHLSTTGNSIIAASYIPSGGAAATFTPKIMMCT